MPSPFDASGAQFAFDSTSIKLAETCLRKYQYKMLQRWQPHRKSVHLLFGGWYATALEEFHKALADGVDYEQAICDVVHEALIATWEYEEDESGEPIEGTGTPWTSDHNTKTRENLIRTIIWYLDQFRDDPCTTVILSNGSAAVEHSFKLDADNGIILAGHLDRLVEYSDKLYIQDQKTTGSTITSRFFEGFNPDTQMSLYTFAGKAIFNLPVKGVMIDGAQIAVGFTRFERGFTFRDDGQLAEWYDGAMLTIERARQATLDNNFPMNPSSCGNYGGCEFRHICARSPSVRQNFLLGDFTQGEQWNPLQER
jgi:PD-(D/E)XK nuclease superfamily